MENNEQAEVEVPEIESQEAVEPQEGIDDILTNALKDKAEVPEDSSQTEEDQAKEQTEEAPDEAEIETPYGEITLDDAKKLTFKSEKEFLSFLDKNPFLKDKFLMQSDYTRKTQQVAQERKAFEEERRKLEAESQGWGKEKPAPDDLKVFQDTWLAFQHGSDALAGKIQAFFNDVSLINQGKNPVGPLANQDGAQNDYRTDAQVIRVKREFDQYRNEQERKEQERSQQERERESAEAKAQVDSWLSSKEKAGIKISNDEFAEMARISKAYSAAGEKITLDEMHRLALAKLGKTEKLAMKKVFVDAKTRSAKTPAKPASRVPSSAKPAGSNQTLDDILNEGIEQLAQR